MTLLEKVKANVVEVGDCWEWLGGYAGKTPRARLNGRMMPVRRALMEEAGISLKPTDYVICRCGNWRCVRPEHAGKVPLEKHMQRIAGTPCVERYIGKKANKKRTPEMDREIMNSNETCKVLAGRFGISVSLVSKVRRGNVMQPNPWQGLMR